MISFGTKHLDLIVFGKGLVAHATALACAHTGLDVAVDLSAPAKINRVYALNAASVAFLQALKVWDLIAPRATPIQRMHVFSGESKLNFDAYQQQVDSLAQIVAHDDLAQALFMALRLQQNLHTHNFQAHDFQRVEGVWLAQQAGQKFSTDLLVGAEGAHSPTRQMAGIVCSRMAFKQTAITATLACEHAHQNVAYQWFETQGLNHQGIVALLPLADAHQVSLVWSAPETLAMELLALNEPEFNHALESASHSILGKLSLIDVRQSAALWAHKVSSLVADGVALVGDSAHGVHPLAGQGLNLGLQDAQCLAQVLAARSAVRHADDAVLLRRYARMRAAQIQAISGITNVLGQSVASHFAVTMPPHAGGFVATLAQSLAAFPHFFNTLEPHAVNLIERLPLIKRSLVQHAGGLPFVHKKY